MQSQNNTNMGGGKEPVQKLVLKKASRGKPYIIGNKFADPNQLQQQQSQGKQSSTIMKWLHF